MLILDTDHLSELDRGSQAARRLEARLSNVLVPVGTTIVSIEEQLRGRLALLARTREKMKLIEIYARLNRLVADFSSWLILPWNEAAADRLARLRPERLKLGTMDLRIASIVLANNATLLSRNLRDFERVPQLRVEDWLS